MKNIDLLEAIGDARESYVYEAGQCRKSGSKTCTKRKLRPMVIAALIGLMIFLMGCAIVVMSLQDFKIGERTSGYGEILDSEGNVIKETKLVQEILSLHGYADSPVYLAHQEWFEFYEEYRANHEMTKEENFFIPPEQYQAYFVFNQEMIDKVDEIAEKYNLKLLGAVADFQHGEGEIFRQAVGINSYLKTNSVATIGRESGYFYQEGNFKVEFDLTMPDEEQFWAHPVYGSIYYSKSDNFDTVSFFINDPENIEQWNYVTNAGDELLIINCESKGYALVYCIRSDAVIYVRFVTAHPTPDDPDTTMTTRQIEQIAEQFDYSLSVETVDMDLAKERLKQFKNVEAVEDTNGASNNQDKYGYQDYIDEVLSMEHPENTLFVLSDINDDGIQELLIGDQNALAYVWRVNYHENGTKSIGLFSWSMDKDDLNALKEAWPNMDRKPVTEYYSE